MSDRKIIEACERAGVDSARLERCLRSGDDWGGMVNAFEYLTVLEAVLAAMKSTL